MATKETKVWEINPQENLIEDPSIQEAAHYLQLGKTVAFPTETVYGLGADATNQEAVSHIFKAKGRPSDNPLIVHIGSRDVLKKYVRHIPTKAEQLIDAFWPGPLTIIMPSNETLAENVTAGLDTIGMRMPDHSHALALLKACERPIAAPSANRSGKPSPTTAEHVYHDLNGRIDGLVDGGRTGVGVESTVIDCSHCTPIILRPGGVTRQDLESVIGPVDVAPSVVKKDESPRSPGMKYQHYAPDTPIWIVQGGAGRMRQLAQEATNNGQKVQFLVSQERADELKAKDALILGSRYNLAELTSQLYDALRQVDKKDVDLVLAEGFPKKGIGEALMNRLERAASDYK
ncbi:L-threonylcarbamoyladenylate synthase [Tenuibacillus multivorans]|uniref:Threonylcarbamoyl-AMP synthase n=1 Tax=Tenuibacillus multivorans TaxID=237069 RepID=A0A1G9X1N6_9BACI|nr:L-threonylcarbamoyladenylate synthase [Tenuibacillus multivorans]GEL77263.1 threonylcarbamoyl-AMP synthase [Tenuibacillus multivorans]SDM90674.1 L-threonylcarbamoyladenylate synthase [Tenuibacillus multivorans]